MVINAMMAAADARVAKRGAAGAKGCISATCKAVSSVPAATRVFA
ncbi:MAG: hypothetical protein U5L03_08080 [Burkholderiaceae bacterium]|nr:hypothetical protein [Burkholderiaceae bacterium]